MVLCRYNNNLFPIFNRNFQLIEVNSLSKKIDAFLFKKFQNFLQIYIFFKDF